MGKRYIFHYDQTQRCWNGRIHNLMIAHDGMECSADIEDAGVLDIVGTSFDDGIELSAFVYELEEIIRN